jgi:hypothetical protein
MAYSEQITLDEMELYKMDMLDMSADDYSEWVELMEKDYGDTDET